MVTNIIYLWDVTIYVQYVEHWYVSFFFNPLFWIGLENDNRYITNSSLRIRINYAVECEEISIRI